MWPDFGCVLTLVPPGFAHGSCVECGRSEGSRTMLMVLACMAGITQLPSVEMGRTAGKVCVLFLKKLFHCLYVVGRRGSKVAVEPSVLSGQLGFSQPVAMVSRQLDIKPAVQGRLGLKIKGIVSIYGT